MRAWLALAAAGGAGLGARDASRLPDALQDWPLVLLAGSAGPAAAAAACAGFAVLTWLLVAGSWRSRSTFHGALCASACASLGTGWILLALANLQVLPATGYPLPWLSFSRTHTLATLLLLGPTLFGMPRESTREARWESPGVPMALLALGWMAVLAALGGWAQPERLAEALRPARLSNGEVVQNPLRLELWERLSSGEIVDRHGVVLYHRGKVRFPELSVWLEELAVREAPALTGLDALEDPALWEQPGREFLDIRELRALVDPLGPPPQGGRLRLALDLELTRELGSILRQVDPGHRGVAVVLDPRSGDLLAMAALTRAESPVRVCFPPGSAWKIVVAQAARHHGLGGARGRCRCHGELGLSEALAFSCNEYFGELAAEVGLGRVLAFARQRLGMALPLYDPDLRRAVRQIEREGGSAATGQGSVLVTAPELAVAAGAVAIGRVVVPRLVLERVGAGRAPVRWRAGLEPAERAPVWQGMQGVLRYGTASRHSFPAEAGGKTGTDEILDSGVFVAATATKTVAVWLEHGGPGGGRAAWVGSRLLRTAGE